MDNYNQCYLGTHYVKYTLQYKDYTGSFVRAVGGNCRGAAVMDTNIFEYLNQHDIDQLYSNDCQLTYNDDVETYGFVLKNKDNEIYENEEYEDEIGNYIVAIEIINFIPD